MAVWRRQQRGRVLLFWVLALLVAGFFYLDFRVRQGFADGRWTNPIRFRAAPPVLKAGMDIDALGLGRMLLARGYGEALGGPDTPIEEAGRFRRTADAVEIFLKPMPQAQTFADRPAFRIRLVLAGSRIRLIRDTATGDRLAEVRLTPLPLAGVLGEHWTRRTEFSLADVPPHVIDAILAAEDAHFLDHPGINLKSMVRAMQVNWRAGRIRQGGSTLTQQFVKNHFLTQDRTFTRKLLEIPIALALEARFSKEEILEAYVGTVYLGHDRLVGVHGLAEGAAVFLGKSLQEMTVADGALLAGLIRAPNIYSPLRRPERALRRRNQVLEEMRDLAWIDDATFLAALRETLPQPQPRPAASEAYFLQEVLREMVRHGMPVDRLGTGSEVFTTLDLALQHIATEEAGKLAARHPGLEVEVVALDPATGALRALVGGSDFLKGQLDRTRRAHLAAGSIFKPFLLLAAFASEPAGITPETEILDAPVTVEIPGGVWRPRNSDGRFRGSVSVGEALSRSLNVPMVRLAQRIGIEELAAFGDTMGLADAPLPRVPALALGAFDASLRNVTASYSIFPNAGEAVSVYAVESVKAPSGTLLYQADPLREARADADAVREVHDLLVSVADEGTARSIGASGVRSAVAGKTGTTNESRGVWFVGYTPDLLLGVRLAYGDRRSLGRDAAQLAVPFWASIVRQAERGYPIVPFAFADPRNPQRRRAE
ncbi:MAG: transglycosylase domain-containing protein [Deltaproteobacteria bacterium]